MNANLYSESKRLNKSNVLSFRCRMDSASGPDVHREFSGCYYPRWRSMYLEEVRIILKEVKMFPIFAFDVYLKPDDDYYFTGDFTVGTKLNFGRTESLRDKGVKTFVITQVDEGKLRSSTEAVEKHFQEKKIDARILENLMKVREAFIHQSGSLELGIKDIGRRFRIMDDDGDRKLTKLEFKKALTEVHLDFTNAEIDEVFSVFDANADGTVSFEELLLVIRGPMSADRKKIVADAFRKCDINGDGVLTLHDLEVKFNAKGHPEVVMGNMTEAQVLHSFLTGWDTRDRNGVVSFAEFCDYYNGLSASVDDDELFCAIVANSWNL